MRILHINQRYWPGWGGAEAHLHELSRRLVGAGHQVTVATTDALDFELLFTPGRRRVEEGQGELDGVRILRFPVRHLPGCPLTYSAWRRLLWLLSAARPVPVGVMTYLARYTPWVPAFRRWLASTTEEFDLIAGMNVCSESLSEAALRLARRRGIPFAMYALAHLGAGARPGQDAVGTFYTMRHQTALVRASDVLIAQTPTESAFYQQRGVSEDRIRVVGPGVNPDEVLGGDGESFRARHHLRGPVIASLSAMAYDKGTVHVVEAVRRLWQAGRKVELVLAGAVLTPFRRYLEGLPAEERSRIHVLGSIDEGEKRDMLAACDLLAMPSRTDSFGIVYLEAWLYRKPVIGARAWGVSDVIEDGRDGLLVPFGDVPALAEAMVYLLEHPGIGETMGAWGERKVYQYHTWASKAALVCDLYERLVEENRADR
jgi:glycosyltransferase involved in cell wall biosynthesis